MTDDAISEEMVLLARDAIAASDGCYGYQTGAVCVAMDGDCACAIAARAALSAALPLIVARERERCAKVAEKYSGPEDCPAAAIRSGNGGE